MPNLLEARALAASMGRKPVNLLVSSTTSGEDDDFFFEGRKIVVRSIVTGGTQEYNTLVVFPSADFRIPVPAEAVENARWHCDCTDFQFTFWHALQEGGYALLSFPVEESQGVRPPRAIIGYGMCKHLMATVNSLEREGTIST